MGFWFLFFCFVWGLIAHPGYEFQQNNDGGWLPSVLPIEESGCTIDRIRVCASVSDLNCFTKAQFRAQYFGKVPVLISGFMESWPARRTFQKESFLSAYGDELAIVGASAEFIYLQGTALSKKIPLREFISHMPAAENSFVFETGVDFYLHDFTIPPWLKDVTPAQGTRETNTITKSGHVSHDKWTVLSLGGDSAGLGWHMHGQSWLSFLLSLFITHVSFSGSGWFMDESVGWCILPVHFLCFISG